MVYEIWCRAAVAATGRGNRYLTYTERFWRDKDAEGKPFESRHAAEAEAVRLGARHHMTFTVREARKR